jgi:hypothetical protein
MRQNLCTPHLPILKCYNSTAPNWYQTLSDVCQKSKTIVIILFLLSLSLLLLLLLLLLFYVVVVLYLRYIAVFPFYFSSLGIIWAMTSHHTVCATHMQDALSVLVVRPECHSAVPPTSGCALVLCLQMFGPTQQHCDHRLLHVCLYTSSTLSAAQ